MKFNLKKVATVIGTTLMLGATVGMAAAASFTPSSFSSDGIALVVGQNAANSDLKAAMDLTANLAPSTSTATTTSSTVEGGDSVKVERSSDKFNLGNSAASVLVTSLDDDNMPNLLAEGTYSDEDNIDHDYTQKITLGSGVNLTHFSDSDYKDRTPTVGIKLNDDEAVLNYTLDFSKNPTFTSAKMRTSTLKMMGIDYYISALSNDSASPYLTLLDSANSAVISEGESITIGDHDVAISFISETGVKLVVDGQTTNTLSSGGSYKLNDGSYVGVKEILYTAKDSGVSKAEITLGTGKLKLTHNNEIELNDVTINGVKAYIYNASSGTELDKIVIEWKVDDESFVTPESELLMPGFESVKLSMAGFYAPKSEKTVVENSGSDVMQIKVPLKDGTVTIPILKADSNGDFELIGKDSSNRLKTSATTSLTFNETAGDKYLVASWNSSTEAESYYLKASMISEDNVNKVRFTNEVTGAEKKVANGSSASFGSVVITVNNLTRDGSLKWADLSISPGGSFNSLYTKEGMKLYLPVDSGVTNTTAKGDISFHGNGNETLGFNATSWYLYVAEEDKDSKLAFGNTFNFTLKDNNDNKVHVSSISLANGYEIDDSDDYEYYVVSDLATKVLHKTGGDQDTVEITYAGDQSYADMFITASGATITGGSSGSTTTTGVMTVWDNQVASVSNKNLIVIGGSCVNSVAAELLGVSAGASGCQGIFEEETGIKAGEALVKSFARSGKTALLVAGYNAEDTEKAVAYVSNNAIDTTVDTALKVTSATAATAIVN